MGGIILSAVKNKKNELQKEIHKLNLFTLLTTTTLKSEYRTDR